MASTSLEVIIAGKDNFTPTAKKVEAGLGRIDKGAKALGKTLAAGFAMGAGIAGFNGFVSVLDKAVGAIPGFIESGLGFAETVDFISDATGASAEAASRFAGQIQYTTGSLDGIVMAMRAATQEIRTNEASLNALGIATRSSNGLFLDTITIIENARVEIAKLGAGSAASQKLIELLGRSGLQFADYMALSAPQVALLNDQLERMGYVVTDVSVFESAKRELNLWDMAWQGLSNTLTATVLPAIRIVLANITEAVVTYGPQIKQVLADIINFIAGVVAGLTNLNVTPFATQMASLGTATGQTVMSFDQWLVATNQTVPATKAATGGVNNLTSALDKQTAALDRQIARIKAADDAMEGVFQRTMGRLADSIGDQIAALDAAEKQRDIDKQRAQYAQDLADARRDLAKALAGDKGIVDADAVAAARDRVRELVDASAEWERSLQVDKVRAGLEQVKGYIEDIARLEAEATNKPALLKNLATRQKVLESERAAAQQRGDLEAVAAYDAKLDAIRTATARTQDAIRAGDKITTLEREKAKINEVRDAAIAANSAVATSTGKTLEELKAEYDTYATEAEASVRRVQAAMLDVNAAAYGTQTGKEKRNNAGMVSPLAQAFIDGKNAAEGLKSTLDTVVTVAKDLAGYMRDAFDWFKKLNDMKPADWLWEMLKLLNPALNFVPDNPLKPQSSSDYGPLHPAVGPPKAAGGPVSAGGRYLVGERGPEVLAIGSRSGYIIPNDALGGAMTVYTTVTLDGEVVGRQVDKYLRRRSGL